MALHFRGGVLEFVVVFRELIEQRLEVPLYGVHRLDERGAEDRAFRAFENFVVARLLRKHERAALEKIGLDERALRHLAGALVRRDLAAGSGIAIRRVPQKDNPQHGHAIFAGGQPGVCTQLIGCLQKAVFEFVAGHSNLPCLLWPLVVVFGTFRNQIAATPSPLKRSSSRTRRCCFSRYVLQ